MARWCNGEGCGRKGLGSCNRFEESLFRSHSGALFREVTYSILRRCDDGKKDQVCCLKDGTDGVVSTASTTTSNPLSTLYCYDISGSNDRRG